MIEFVPSTICQKLVVGQQSNSFKKKNKTKRRNSDVPRFECRVTFLFNTKLKMFL